MSEETVRPYKIRVEINHVFGGYPSAAQFQDRRSAVAFRREFRDLLRRWHGEIGSPMLVERLVAQYGGVLGPTDRLMRNAGLVGRER